jgi:hypothetical protein
VGRQEELKWKHFGTIKLAFQRTLEKNQLSNTTVVPQEIALPRTSCWVLKGHGLMGVGGIHERTFSGPGLGPDFGSSCCAFPRASLTLQRCLSLGQVELVSTGTWAFSLSAQGPWNSRSLVSENILALIL